MRKHGKILSWEDLYIEPQPTKPKIQKVLREDGSYTIHVFLRHSMEQRKIGVTSYEPSYKGLKTLIFAMVSLYGKKKVEKELGIKIEEE